MILTGADKSPLNPTALVGARTCIRHQEPFRCSGLHILRVSSGVHGCVYPPAVGSTQAHDAKSASRKLARGTTTPTYCTNGGSTWYCIGVRVIVQASSITTCLRKCTSRCSSRQNCRSKDGKSECSLKVTLFYTVLAWKQSTLPLRPRLGGCPPNPRN